MFFPSVYELQLNKVRWLNETSDYSGRFIVHHTNRLYIEVRMKLVQTYRRRGVRDPQTAGQVFDHVTPLGKSALLQFTIMGQTSG